MWHWDQVVEKRRETPHPSPPLIKHLLIDVYCKRLARYIFFWIRVVLSNSYTHMWRNKRSNNLVFHVEDLHKENKQKKNPENKTFFGSITGYLRLIWDILIRVVWWWWWDDCSTTYDGVEVVCQIDSHPDLTPTKYEAPPTALSPHEGGVKLTHTRELFFLTFNFWPKRAPFFSNFD